MKTLSSKQLLKIIKEEITSIRRSRINELSTGGRYDAYPDDNPRCPECDGELDFNNVCSDPYCGRDPDEFFCPLCGEPAEVHGDYVSCDTCDYEAELTPKRPVEPDFSI